MPPTKTAPTKTAPATAPPAPRLEVLPVGQIRTGPNVRTALGDLKELAASIKALGVIEPLIVEPNGKGYRVIAGHRRLAAAKVAGLRQVPAIVRTVEDAERIELQLIENLQRADLSPTEEASAFERLITEHGYTHRKLGERIGRSQGHISKRLSLLTLPATAQAAVDSGRISIEGGLELTKLAGEPARVAAVLKHDPREIPRQVERQLAAIETGARVAALHEQIAKEGLRTIALVPDRYGGRPVLPKGAMPLGNDWRELHIDPGKHSKLDCHAVYVEMSAWGKPKIRAVCTDAAKQHPAEVKKSESPYARAATGPLSDDEKVRRKKRREHVAAMREAKAARHAFMVGLLAKPVDHDEAIATLVGAWLTPDRRDRGAATGAIAAQLLGLDVPEPKDRWDRPDRRTAVAAFALKSKANVARAALALGFEAAETFIEDPTATYYWPTDAVKAHIELLRSHGYAPSPAERASLAGKAPR